MEVEYVDSFSEKYLRNYKDSGKKNLRCFPSCSPKGHKATGFCGQPVRLKVSNLGFPVEELRAWAQFERKLDKPDLSIGCTIPETEVLGKERNRKDWVLSWMRCKVVLGDVKQGSEGKEILQSSQQDDEGKATLFINSELMGWHYGWNSNKHAKDSAHVIRTYLFRQEGRLLRFVGVFTSSPFVVFCRKRTRPNQVEKPNSKQKGGGNHKRCRLEKREETGLPQHLILKLMEYVCFQGSEKNQCGQRNMQFLEIHGARSSMEDFSSNFLGGIVCGYDFDEIFSSSSSSTGASIGKRSSASPSPTSGMVDLVKGEVNKSSSLSCQLARYLTEEKSFTESISFFFQINALDEQDEESLSRLFEEFTDLIRSHVSGFLAKKRISMEEFEKELNAESDRFNKYDFGEYKQGFANIEPSKKYFRFRNAFLRRLQSETGPIAFPPNQAPVPAEFDINGTWLNTGELQDSFQSAHLKLKSRGYPIFIFKMIRTMLWRFRVTISKDWAFLQGEKKLMSNAEFLFRLDGLDHTFEIPHVVPLGLPSVPCLYRANMLHRNGVRIISCVIHGFFPRLHGVRFEIIREIEIINNRQTLVSNVTFDLIRANGDRETVTSFRQRFFQTNGEEELNELVDLSSSPISPT